VKSACPDTFHLCPQSAAHEGFSVVDRATGNETAANSETEARQIAERTYPGCTFALSTIAATHPDLQLPSSVPDAVVMVILRQIEGLRYNVVAYVVSGVAGASCIPFSQSVWPAVKDHLPRDHRRSTPGVRSSC
jgi:hypothetical protein